MPRSHSNVEITLMKPNASAVTGARRVLFASSLPSGALLSLAMLLSGCETTTPATQPALAQARTEVETLEADPLAAQSAGKPLQEARDALAAAEQAAQAHRPDVEVQHLAYLASRRAEVGEAVIAEVRARTAMAQAQAHRDQLLLAQREREAEAARIQAQQARQQAQLAQAQTQQAQAQTQQAEADADATRAQLEALQARQTERGMVLSLGSNVLFDTGRDTLKPGADAQLGRLGQFMQSHANLKVRIEGFTDSVGSDSYNDDLSQRRADAVARALESHGVDASHIVAVGRGKSLPVASNDTPEGRQQNRRVDVVFSDTEGQFASAD
jgi:outer membrane protein OmpA-like peptidoglycan-associated protein